MGTSCWSSRDCNWVSSCRIASSSAASRSARFSRCARGFLEPGLVLVEGGVQGDGQGDEVFSRSVPARELRQGGRRRLRRAGELAPGLGEPRIQVAGLASLADRAAEPFDIAGDLQLGQLLLMPVDLGVMPDDRSLRLLGLSAQLGELLTQPADDHRLIGAEPQRLGLVQVGRSAQLAEDPPRLVLAVVLIIHSVARGPPPPFPRRPAAPGALRSPAPRRAARGADRAGPAGRRRPGSPPVPCRWRARRAGAGPAPCGTRRRNRRGGGSRVPGPLDPGSAGAGGRRSGSRT